MALSFDDRILGEKTHYYCSSSEDEDDHAQSGDSDADNDEGGGGGGGRALSFVNSDAQDEGVAPPPTESYAGRSTNTGPKGVVEDWRRFKQLEAEKRDDAERERLALARRLALTCRSAADDEAAAAADAAAQEQLEELLEHEDRFLEEYRQRRLDEMRLSVAQLPRFGSVCALTKSSFLAAIDQESKSVKIIIHLFEDDVAACTAVSGCFRCLAEDYLTVKFCELRASTADMSKRFSRDGVPAIVVYKAGELIANLVNVSAELGSDFFAGEMETYLAEHGLLDPVQERAQAAYVRNLRGAEPCHAVKNDGGLSDSDLD